MKLENMLNSGLRFLWLSGIVLILDRISKYMVNKWLIPYIAYPVLPGLNFELSYNTGAAFSFLDSASGWQVWFFGATALLVTLMILIWLSKISYLRFWTASALCLIVGGAIGNLWDRIAYGRVTDFIQVYVSAFYWPSFNIADSAICIGAIMLLIHSILEKRHST